MVGAALERPWRAFFHTEVTLKAFTKMQSSELMLRLTAEHARAQTLPGYGQAES
jgi:hypothetical protein